MKTRLAILVTHPIQYFVPWFRELSRLPELELTVYYCFRPSSGEQGKGFGVPFQWDCPLDGGYQSILLKNVSSHPTTSRYRGCDTPEISQLVASGRHDVWLVHGWMVKSYWQAMKTCWKQRVPLLVRGDSHLLDRRPWPVRLAKRLLLGRWIPRFSSYLTVGTLNEACYEFYGADRSRFFRVPHCVDNNWFAEKSKLVGVARLSSRQRLGVPTDAMVFLFCGKFIEKKRPLDLLQALDAPDCKETRAHALFVGDGPLRKACESYARTRNIASTFVGFKNQSELPEMYAVADVLVLPSSHSETWGLVVNEAMACQRPALVSDKVGCGPDLVLEGKTGYVFPCGEIGALREALLRYVSRPDLAVSHGGVACDHVGKHYSLEIAVSGTLRAVQAVRAQVQTTCIRA